MLAFAIRWLNGRSMLTRRCGCAGAAAIDELHHMKADWFTGENIEGSILAMLLLSQSYEDLRLHMAARYYAAAALFTALHVDSDRTSRLISQAAFRVAHTFYVAGEGITYIYSLCGALELHHSVASDPHDWTKHPQVQATFANAVILRAIGQCIGPPVVPLIDDAIAAWPLPRSELDAFRAMSEKEPWSHVTVEEFASELGQHPFGDMGPERSIDWSAFGIVWTIRCVAEKDTWLAALELAAAIQIAHVEFAETDLLIIPSRAMINVVLADETKPQCVQLPDNGKLAWMVSMPKAIPETSGGDSEAYQAHLMALVLMVVGQATALPVSKFDKVVEKILERGLPGRVFSVRPLRELMKLAQPERLDFPKLKTEARPTLHTEFQPMEPDELKWRTGPGPGYSRSLAEQHLRNRYENVTHGLRLTLPRIVDNDHCRRMLLRLRAEGFPDWQLLSALLSIVAQWQVEAKLGHPLSHPAQKRLVGDRILRDEQDYDPPFDLGVLTEDEIRFRLKMNTPAALNTWGLTSHRQTPDFDAIKRLLDERYRHSADDIPHADPLVQNGSGEAAETIGL